MREVLSFADSNNKNLVEHLKCSFFPPHIFTRLLYSDKCDSLLTLLRKTNWSTQCRDIFWLKRAVSVCGSCTLAVLVGCGLSSVLFVYPQFLFFSPLVPLISLTVASLQGVAQDFMLSCNHCLTLSLFSVIFLSCWSLLQPPQLCSLLYLLLSISVVVLHRCRFSFSGVILWVRLLFVDLLSFWLSDTLLPPLPAVRSPMVQCCACLQFCGWSVGLSPVHVKLCQLVLCCGLSSEWTMCIKLRSFLVWHRLIPTFRVSTCHVEVMLSWNDFPFSKILCGDFWWNSEWGSDDDSEGVLGLKCPKNIRLHGFNPTSPNLWSSSSSLWMFSTKYEEWAGRKCWSS